MKLVSMSDNLLLHSWAHHNTQRQNQLGTGSASSTLERLAVSPERYWSTQWPLPTLWNGC